MRTRIIKSITFLGLSFLSLFSFISYALDDDSFATFGELQPVMENIFNIVVASAAAIMIAMVAYGLWKSSMSMGDPRGLEGAKGVWTYAIFGFLIIVLFFVLFTIIASLFGIGSLGSPKNILGQVFGAINDLVTAGQGSK